MVCSGDTYHMEISYLGNLPVYLGKNEVATARDKRIEQQLGNSGAVIAKLKCDLFGFGYNLFLQK